MLEEEYTDNFDINAIIKELEAYKRFGYKALKGYYILQLIEENRIRQSDMQFYGLEKQHGYGLRVKT